VDSNSAPVHRCRLVLTFTPFLRVALTLTDASPVRMNESTQDIVPRAKNEVPPWVGLLARHGSDKSGSGGLFSRTLRWRQSLYGWEKVAEFPVENL